MEKMSKVKNLHTKNGDGKKEIFLEKSILQNNNPFTRKSLFAEDVQGKVSLI